ncbi:hypothetical protein PHSC3_000361 [Chlamydiales bacterium STE3]|nr:hypothetical protein PHSC3_000361 [Chlamydiales bacterium STE3]
MKAFKRLIATATAFAMVALSSQSLQAEDYYASNTGGYGYSETRQTPALAPAIALGTVALVAIIAVALQDSTSSHSHGHNL